MQSVKKNFSIKSFLFLILSLIYIISIFFVVSLLSFNSSDKSWSQASNSDIVNNLCGSLGAWVADIFFSFFGIIAFTFSPLLIFIFLNIYKKLKKNGFIDFFYLVKTLVYIIIFIITSCGLISLIFNDFKTFHYGGIIGDILINILLIYFDLLKIILILLFFFIISIIQLFYL
ncbi:DNA translocase FtsK 4TM domain-containing protein [Candidatus Providencia siddallii]|uniref:DNA translocase FtsK, partial n=1 Tax=Candidatus Providencia siddallii TaxID=1715285 RepID=A0ABM9NNZ9_9GAMM